jgi:hypothetical protein
MHLGAREPHILILIVDCGGELGAIAEKNAYSCIDIDDWEEPKV